MLAVGMLFGDIFAVFILHQNAGQQGAALIEASRAVADRDPAAATAVRAASLGGRLRTPAWARAGHRVRHPRRISGREEVPVHPLRLWSSRS